MSKLSIPGKIFLIGEYSVLQGGRALIAALRPGYQFQFGEGEPAHLDSPLGRYANEVGNPLLFSQLEMSMRPGFGSSTAELIAGVIHDVERLPETKRIWSWYKEQVPNASGADLAVQMEAYRSKRSLFEFNQGDVSPFQDTGISEHIFVFQAHATQKIKTHEILKTDIPKIPTERVNEWVREIKYSFESGNLENLLKLNAFADEMHDLGLETQFAHEVRKSFQKINGVLAVKGCGGGLNDAFLIVSDAKNLNPELQNDFRRTAEKFGLTDLGRLKEILW